MIHFLSMPTIKKRINITVDDQTHEALSKLSKQRGASVSSIGLDLIEQALEFQEDVYFSDIADKRLTKKEKRVSHKKAWG